MIPFNTNMTNCTLIWFISYHDAAIFTKFSMSSRLKSWGSIPRSKAFVTIFQILRFCLNSLLSLSSLFALSLAFKMFVFLKHHSKTFFNTSSAIFRFESYTLNFQIDNSTKIFWKIESKNYWLKNVRKKSVIDFLIFWNSFST